MDRIWGPPTQSQVLQGYSLLTDTHFAAASRAKTKSSLECGEVQRQTIDTSESICTCTISVSGADVVQPFPMPELLDVRWDDTKATAFVENFFAEQQELSPYFVAEAKEAQERIDCGLPPNPLTTSDRLLACCQELPGISTPYLYISSGQSCGFLHKEDMNLLSANILHRGYPNIWIIIPARESDKLEARIADSLLLQYTCDQFIRHANVMISPAQLKLWEVDYSLVVQNAGDFILTDLNVYHQVLKPGPNMAEAINGCEESWQPPVSYLPCRKRCNSQNEPITRELFLITATSQEPEAAASSSKQAGPSTNRSRRGQKKKSSYDTTYSGSKPRTTIAVPINTPSSEERQSATDLQSDDDDDDDVGRDSIPPSSPLPSKSDEQVSTQSKREYKSPERPTSFSPLSSQGDLYSQPKSLNENTSRLSILKSLIEEAISLGGIIFPREQLDLDDLQTIFNRYLPGDTTSSWLCDRAVMATMKVLTSTSPDYMVVDALLYEWSSISWAAGLPPDIEHVFLPRCQEQHWELIHIQIDAKVIRLYGSHSEHFLQWSEKVKTAIDPVAAWTTEETPPFLKQLNIVDCALFMFAQAEIIMDKGLLAIIPKDSIGLRAFYLTKLVEWARFQSKDKDYLMPVLNGYSSLEVSPPTKRFKPTLPISLGFDPDLMTAFGSPHIFANICILRHNQVYADLQPEALICAALNLVTRSKSNRLQSLWHISLADAIILHHFRVLTDEAKTEIYEEKKRRRRARDHGELSNPTDTRRAAARAEDAILRRWGAAEEQRKLLKHRLKAAHDMNHLFALTGDGFKAPFWMLAPIHEYKRFSAFTHASRTEFLTDLKNKRPRLIERHDTICSGLRVVLGLDKGRLRIDEMDPGVLANESQDSDLLMNCLERLS